MLFPTIEKNDSKSIVVGGIDKYIKAIFDNYGYDYLFLFQYSNGENSRSLNN